MHGNFAKLSEKNALQSEPGKEGDGVTVWCSFCKSDIVRRAGDRCWTCIIRLCWTWIIRSLWTLVIAIALAALAAFAICGDWFRNLSGPCLSLACGALTFAWVFASWVAVCVFCDARLGGIDHPFRWAALNCLLPGIGLVKYLRHKRVALSSKKPQQDTTGAADSLMMARTSKVTTVAVVTMLLLYGCGPGSAFYYLSFTLALKLVFLCPFPWLLFGVCLYYCLNAVMCFVMLLGAWGFGIADFIIGGRKVPIAPIPTDPKNSLSVAGCEELTVVPDLPTNLKELQIVDCPGITSIPALPDSLTSLQLDSCANLITISQLPQSLTYLRAENCPVLSELPKLPNSLTDLLVFSCPRLNNLPALPNTLVYLSIDNCPGLTSLPEFPNSLICLRIDNCPELKTLPEITTSLKDIRIDGVFGLSKTQPAKPPAIDVQTDS
jgi:hypothetical protein